MHAVCIYTRTHGDSGPRALWQLGRCCTGSICAHPRGGSNALKMSISFHGKLELQLASEAPWHRGDELCVEAQGQIKSVNVKAGAR